MTARSLALSGEGDLWEQRPDLSAPTALAHGEHSTNM